MNNIMFKYFCVAVLSGIFAAGSGVSNAAPICNPSSSCGSSTERGYCTVCDKNGNQYGSVIYNDPAECARQVEQCNGKSARLQGLDLRSLGTFDFSTD